MCATSIGLTFSHMPFPGVRKSGIPDGTEIPAPVGRLPAPRRGAGRLPTLELRLPLAEECADPLLRVLGLERIGEALRLRLQPLVQIAVRGHALDLLDGDRRLPGE